MASRVRTLELRATPFCGPYRVLARFAVDDKEDDKEDKPRVFLPDKDSAEANETNEEAHDGHDDDANDDGDMAVRDGFESEATRNATDTGL